MRWPDPVGPKDKQHICKEVAYAVLVELRVDGSDER
jgi:hypothetical protein